MKKNYLLNKPIILSLLFLLIIICVSLTLESIFHLLKIKSSITSLSITNTIAAFIFGLIYTKISKEMLSKKQKTKMTLYIFLIYFVIFTTSVFIFMDLLNKPLAFFVSDLIIFSLSSIALAVSIYCIYPSLNLGCKITSLKEPDNIEKTKLQDCLLIIFLIALTMCYEKYSNMVIDGLTNPILKHMGYVRGKPVNIEPEHFEDKISISGFDFVRTSDYANLKLEYYYYIPKSIKKNKKQKVSFLILVVDIKGKEQKIDAQLFKDFAQQKGFVIISPHFIQDETYWNIKKSYQYPAVWSGDAFNNVLDDFKKKHHIDYKELYFFGNLAGAQFSERYSFLYPEKVRACFLFNPNGDTLPTKKQKMKFMVTVGTKETDVRKKTAKDFYNTAKKLGIDVKYKEYNTENKFANEQIKDSIMFFKSVK